MRLFQALLLLGLVTVFLAGTAPAAARPAAQQPICFPNTPGIDDCIEPAFADYWRTNGGLPVFGYPIAPAGPYTPPGTTAPLTAQWTERNRLELHPENQRPYNVLIGRVGAEGLAKLGRDPTAGGSEAGPQPGCLWFPETRHNVCDQGAGVGFKSYWERNGLRIAGLTRYQQSLALFGLPLTTANPEPGPNGELVVTQWFERARFEWHPDKPDQFKVLLGLLGRELSSGGASVTPPPASEPAAGPSVFGVEIGPGTVEAMAGRLSEANIAWVRYNGVTWDTVEPRRGERRWETLAPLEAELAALSATGAKVTLVVRGAPTWAQQVRGKACGPLRAQALPDFAAFMGELVTRLSKPPYNIKHWELGNEPDAAHQLLAGNEPFGCWGDRNKADYGGGDYAAMLKAVYPAIKAADPEAQVILGGLLLECDPTRANRERPCASGTFFDGVLQAGGGAAIDIVAYHSYLYWGPITRDWDLDGAEWAPRGGALLGKLALLRETMTRYGVDKPVIMNEGGLLCYRNDPSCAPQGFYEAQANHAMRMYTRAWAAGLPAAFWYTLNGPGWQDGGLLDAIQQPRPAFLSVRFLARQLAGAQLEGKTVDGSLERYEFRKGSTRYTILWTNDGTSRDVPAPQSARTVYSVTGEPRPAAATLTAGFEPILVESGAP